MTMCHQKLTTDIAEEIRAHARLSETSMINRRGQMRLRPGKMLELQARYGVCANTIRMIIAGYTYKT